MSPEVSVVICTLDRPDLVRQALESLRHQTIAPTRFEVLVVDNGTGSVAADLTQIAATTPNLRVVHEPELGLSHARNRGVREAQAEVVLFMDDDAVADPLLLEAHLRQLAEPHRPAATGGRILLRWPSSRPDWVPASVETYYSGLDLGEATRRLHYPAHPYGANMSVRRDMLLAVGGFDAELGRRGSNLISGEETDLFAKLDRDGALVDYVPDAVVHHCVLPDRTRRRWLLRRSWAQGRSDISLEFVAGRRLPTHRLLLRSGLHAYRAGTHAVGFVIATLTRRSADERMRRACQTLRWTGSAFEGMVRARRSRSAA